MGSKLGEGWEEIEHGGLPALSIDVACRELVTPSHYYSRMAVNTKLKACINFVDLSDEFIGTGSEFAHYSYANFSTPDMQSAN